MNHNEAGLDPALHAAILDTIPCAVVATDADGRIRYWNRAASSLSGHEAVAVLGRSCRCLRTRSADDEDEALLAAICPGGDDDTEDRLLNLRHRDGHHVPVVRRRRRISDGTGRSLGEVLVFIDISSQQRAREAERLLTDERLPNGRFGAMIGHHPSMRRLFATVEMVAPSDAGVVISGETGTGKELLAREIHRRSERHDGPFVALNCGALPKDLVEAELFGHARGAFTGAHQARPGRFEAAAGGTLFLDEVADLPAAAQVSLLRVLQEREVTRIGETSARRIDVRVIAASNKELEDEVAAGRFREDLFFRLQVVVLRIPPLRERREDIPLLVDHFVRVLNNRYDRTVAGLEPEAMLALQAHPLPGNVRQLEHAIEHAFVVSPRDVKQLGWEFLPGSPASGPVLDEASEVRRALLRCNGNRSRAAELLGMSRSGFYKRLRRLGIA